MDLAIDEAGTIGVVIIPVEELDAGNTAAFKLGMTPLLETHTRLALDLGMLRFVDSSGLGAFLSCLRKLKEKGGELKLFGMSKAVRAVFELVRLHRVFDIYATRAEAVGAFAA